MSEHFCSGYCRQLDSARMVEVLIESGQVEEIDCSYGNCKFQSSCQIAQAIDEILNN